MVSVIIFMLIVVSIVKFAESSSIGNVQLNRNDIVGRNLLLYKLSEDKAIYIVDKMRKIALDDRSSTFGQDGGGESSDQEFSLLYSNDDYMLIGALDALYNISISGDLNNPAILNKVNIVITLIKYFIWYEISSNKLGLETESLDRSHSTRSIDVLVLSIEPKRMPTKDSILQSV